MNAPPIQLEVHVPAPDRGSGAGFLHAYTQALCKEITYAAQEVSSNDIRTLYLEGAGFLADEDLNVLLRTLHRSLSLTDTEKTVQVGPGQMSTARLTTLRNFYFDIYEMDFGSLNYVDFMRLGRPYSYEQHEWLKKLFSGFEMTCIRSVLYGGLPGQTESSLMDSLNRAAALPCDGIALVPGTNGNPDPEAAARLFRSGSEHLASLGYERRSVYSYAKAGTRDRRTALQQTDIEYWGFGLGAVSCLDGCILQNTQNADAYIHALTGPTPERNALARAVRLDSLTRMRNRALRGLQNAEGFRLSDLNCAGDGTEEDLSRMNACFSEMVRQGYAEWAGDEKSGSEDGEGDPGRIRLTDLGIASGTRAFSLLQDVR